MTLPTSTVRRHQRSPLFSLANISVTVKLWIQVFWVISVQFDLRNTLPKSGLFLLLHPVYIYIYIYNQFQFGLEIVEWTSSTIRLLRCEDVFYDDVSSEGNDNEQSANAYLWKNVAVYFKVIYQHSPRVNKENPEDIRHNKRYPSQDWNAE